MPRFVSVLGKFFPAKERATLFNSKDEEIKNPSAPYSRYHEETVPSKSPYIYEGPDRAAMFQLWKEGNLEYLGEDFRKSPEFLKLLRDFNFKSSKSYFDYIGYNIKLAEEKAMELAEKVTGHELPNKVEEIKKLGGGSDTSGQGNIRYGGFGQPPKE